MASFSRDDVAAIIKEDGVDNLSAKGVRIRLEEKFGLEPGALKAQKALISTMIDEVINEEGGGDDAEEDEEEEEEAPAPAAKKAKVADDANPNKGKASCTTRSGEEAPKNVKKMQEVMKMTSKKFLESKKSIEIDVDGNSLRGEPRSFSSGAMGWYLGGKVEIEVGGQTVRRTGIEGRPALGQRCSAASSHMPRAAPPRVRRFGLSSVATS